MRASRGMLAFSLVCLDSDDCEFYIISSCVFIRVKEHPRAPKIIAIKTFIQPRSRPYDSSQS
jgi:hypothetical protein